MDKSQTAAEIEAAFKKDLNELLKKYGADLEVTDDGKSYGMHSGRCEITTAAVYDPDTGGTKKEFSVFDLDTYMDGG